MKKIILLLILTLLPLSAYADKEVIVKYRDTPVNIEADYFEWLDTSKSSWIKGAWYDAKHQYVIINLSGTNYHYCIMPADTWQQFKKSASFGSAYNSVIKGKYVCRVNPVPLYK